MKEAEPWDESRVLTGTAGADGFRGPADVWMFLTEETWDNVAFVRLLI